MDERLQHTVRRVEQLLVEADVLIGEIDVALAAPLVLGCAGDLTGPPGGDVQGVRTSGSPAAGEALDHGEELPEVEGLGQVPDGPDLRGATLGVLGGGDYDHRGVGPWLFLVGPGETPAVNSGHVQIQQDNVGVVLSEEA